MKGSVVNGVETKRAAAASQSSAAASQSSAAASQSSAAASQSSAAASQSSGTKIDGLSRAELLDVYRVMLRSRKLDDKEIQLKNQSLTFFQISGAGHEAVLVAAGQHLRAGHDWFLTYYRDRALALTIGVTPLDMLLGSVGASTDPASGGRQMPSHWSNPRLKLPSASSAVATQCLHGIGCAEAGRLYERLADIPDRRSEERRVGK